MTDLTGFIPAWAGSVQSDRGSASTPYATSSILGAWGLHARSVREWVAEPDDKSPFGRIVLQADGWVEILLSDAPGWRPFASLSGTAEGRLIQLTSRYAYDGTMVESQSVMQYDATLDRYAGFGPTSDGTLASEGLRSRILVAAIDRQDWQLNDIVFGWVQINE